MHKQSLFHISKRDALPWYQAMLIRGGAIVLALIVCALVTMLLTGENPISIYGTIFYGAFGTARKSWVTFQNLAVLLGISLAVTPAFKMRFWNIGAEGQVLIGCLATAACMIVLGDKTGWILLGLVWGIAIVGIIINACWITCPKWFSSVLYIGMGWVCVLSFTQLLNNLSRAAFGWLLAGGIIYTVGGIIYALKLPLFNSRHKAFGSHEIFHLFVMGGSLCHFILMYRFVSTMPLIR